MKARLFHLCVVAVSICAVCAIEPAQPTAHLVQRDQSIQARQLGLPGLGGGSGTNDTTTEITTTLITTTPVISTPITTTTTTTSTSSTSSTSTRSTSSTAPATTSARPTTTPASTVVVTSTLASGPTTSTDVASAATASATSASSDSDGNSHTGLIVGVSVVGGLALIGALIFLWMKFGGRRFSDYQDEDTDIKWPELKADGDSAAMQPLPARRTGGAGFDMANEFEEMRDTDGQSMAEYGNDGRDSMMDSSTALHTGVGAGSGAYSAAGGGAYHDDGNSGSNHYAAPAYYDQYGGYNNTQGQGYYSDQGQGQYSDNYPEYHNQADPYDAARNHAASTSPQMQPYRSQGSQGMHQGY